MPFSACMSCVEASGKITLMSRLCSIMVVAEPALLYNSANSVRLKRLSRVNRIEFKGSMVS